MSEKTPPPVKRGDGGPPARGIKSGPPIDPNSETLHGFEPVATAPSGPPAGETNAQAGEATLKPGSATMVPHDPAPVLAVRPVNLDQTVSAPIGPADQTMQAGPDATLGALDANTREFHKAALAAAPKAVATGQTFGQYELLEPIAKGGMGIVYKARQKTLNRIVAIKMILAGQFADQGDIDRFYAEAEAAAALSHPNIVAIHEIGEINGQHFFSMDYIEGKSLAGLIQENPVPPRRAAELTKIITETMEFAHEKGVVHRDMKPANVLLDKRQRPLITDFGLAKQVSNTSQLTMAGSIVGTPSYMPPEQAAGKIEEVGPWSDLYSIGAILYELLTGRPPFRAASPFETIRQVLETEPPSPRLLNPNVPKDLETICLKCLQKERTRRYVSCQELSDELGRYLRGEPIQARPISQVARFWRLCKRNPITSSAIALAVVFLIAASIVSTVAAVWTNQALAQEKVAKALAVRSNRKTKQAINDLFTTVSENTLFNQPGAQAVRKQLLEKARAYYEELSHDSQDDPELAVDLADAYFRLGRIAEILEDFKAAEKPLQEARDQQKRLLADKPNDTDLLKALGDTLTYLGRYHSKMKDYAAANEEFTEAVRIRQRLADAFPNDEEYQRKLANAYMNTSLALFNMAQVDSSDKVAYERLMAQARDRNEKAQEIRRARLDIDDSNLEIRRDLAKGYYNLGDIERVWEKEGHLARAIDNFQKAAGEFDRLLEKDQASLENQNYLATCRRLVGSLFVTAGKIAEARQWYEQSLNRLEKLVKENPDVPDYQARQAQLLLSLFELENGQGSTDAAKNALLRARQIYVALVEQNPDVAVYQRELALTLLELSKLQDAGGDAKSAHENIQESIRLYSALVQLFPNEVEYLRELANIHMEAGVAARKRAKTSSSSGNEFEAQISEAREQFEKAQKMRLDLLAKYEKYRVVLDDLGNGYYAQAVLSQLEGKMPQAIEAGRKGVDVFEGLLRDYDQDTAIQNGLANGLQILGDVLWKDGQHVESLQAYRRALELRDQTVTSNPDEPFYSAQKAILLEALSSLEKEQGDRTAAKAHLQQASTVYGSLAEKFSDTPAYARQWAISLHELAVLERASGENTPADDHLKKAIELLQTLIMHDPNDAESANELKKIHAAAGAPEAAL